MKKNTLYKVLMAVAATTLFNNANAQTGSMYFMKWNPQQHLLNPAFQPQGNFYIGVPGLSSINLYGGNNDLVFTDLFQNITVDGKKQTVLFFDKKAKDGSIDDYLDALSDKTHVFYDHRINLLDFGFKAWKGFVTFNVTNRASVNATIPKAISELAFKGINEGESYHLDGKDLSTDATLYTEIGVGYSRAINEKLDIGAKLKFLYGHANMHTNFNNIDITGNENNWSIIGDGYVQGAVPGVTITEQEDGQIDDIDFDDNLATSEYAKARGKGFAVDLGATYKILPQLTVSASVLDLGFIRWNKDLHRVNKVNDFIWHGIAYDINDDTTDYGQEYEDLADSMFRVDHNAKSYGTMLNTKFMLGGEYTIWDDRLGFGLLLREQLYNESLYGDGVASVNFRPWRQLSATLTYGLFDGEWNNVGAGFNVNAGPINLYCAAENIPLKFAKSDGTLIPSNLRNFKVSLGMNLYFGYSGKKDKEKQEKAEEKAIQPENAILVDNREVKIESADDVTNEGNELIAQNTIKEVEKVAVDSATIAVGNTIKEVEKAATDTVAKLSQNTIKEAADTAVVAVRKTVEPIVTVDSSAIAKVSTEKATPKVDTIMATPVKIDTVVPQPAVEPQQVAEQKQEEVKEVTSKEIPASLTAIKSKALYGIKFLSTNDHAMAIDPISYPLLNDLANQLKANPDVNMTIECHSSIVKDKDFTYFVTEEHANLIRGYLIDKDIDYSRMTTVGMGADRPVVSVNAADAKKKNTRVELKFTR